MDKDEEKVLVESMQAMVSIIEDQIRQIDELEARARELGLDTEKLGFGKKWVLTDGNTSG